ncbi:MAG: hypothetical protein A2X86_14515 [Bdellovibrionales bacterium GWA2_49_15]|nr:MAG: hypothetical protein A2X86_14515 [Bdellovibrionales bacterium GWA2_49_15]HAZ13818.1 hypothetical protein [Bdellovibrionales bacterium]
MGLKILNIVFSSQEDFMKDVKSSLFDEKKLDHSSDTISFDSIETFKRAMSSNKLEILMAIARFHPESMNQLAKLLNREYPHVYKDCKTLETLGFIKLREMDIARKQLIPSLAFEYDIIRVQSKIEEIFPISALSNRVLLDESGLY